MLLWCESKRKSWFKGLCEEGQGLRAAEQNSQRLTNSVSSPEEIREQGLLSAAGWRLPWSWDHVGRVGHEPRHVSLCEQTPN